MLFYDNQNIAPSFYLQCDVVKGFSMMKVYSPLRLQVDTDLTSVPADRLGHPIQTHGCEERPFRKAKGRRNCFKFHNKS